MMRVVPTDGVVGRLVVPVGQLGQFLAAGFRLEKLRIEHRPTPCIDGS